MLKPEYIDTGAIVVGLEGAKHRLALWRLWSWSKPPMVVAMLNPSTADAEKDDPTMRQVVHCAAAGDFGGVMVVNMFSLMSKTPDDLLTSDSPISLLNDYYVRQAIEPMDGRVVVCAWGANAAKHPKRAAEFEALLRFESNADLMCFGHTKDGQPRHPLYLGESFNLEAF